MKRWGMISCGPERAARVEEPWDWCLHALKSMPAEAALTSIIVSLLNSTSLDKTSRGTDVSRRVEHTVPGVTWLKDSGPETSYFLAEASPATGVSTLATLRFHSSARPEGDRLGHYNMPQLSQLNNVPAHATVPPLTSH